MANTGSVIGALLQGSAQGFLEAKEEDKIKKQQAKDTATLQKRETVQAFLDQPDLKQSARLPLLAFLAGGPGARQAEKDIAEMLLTGRTPGTEREEVTSGASPLGPAAVNQEGKLDATSPTNVAIGAADREAPLGLQLPPAESFAPLDDFSTLSPRESVFLSPEEERATARGERRLVAADAREDEALLEADRIDRRGANITSAIEGLGMEQDDPMRLALLESVNLFKIGQEDVTKTLLTLQQNPGLGLTEIGEAIDNLDLGSTTTSAVIELLQATNPHAFASLGKTAQTTLVSMIKLRRNAQRQDVEGKQAKIDLDNRREKLKALTNRQQALMLAGMGDMDPKDANVHIDKLRTIEKAYVTEISKLTLAQIDVDSLTQEPISKQAFDAIQIDKEQMLWQLRDTRSQIERWESKVAKALGDVDEDGNLPIVGDNDGTAANVQRIRVGVTLTDEQKALDAIPNDDPRKRQALIKVFSNLPEGVAFNELRALHISQEPLIHISSETMDFIMKKANENRADEFPFFN